MTAIRNNAILQEIIRRESRSFLQYVGDSFPWTTVAEREALAQVVQIIAEQKRGIGDLTRFLERRRVTVPYLGSYPAGFTSWNFCSFERLLPRLVDEGRRGLDALTNDLSQIDAPEVHAQVERFLLMKQQHLKTLEGLLATAPRPAAAG